jgi:tetratricopeptide (TPR) repeat protein
MVYKAWRYERTEFGLRLARWYVSHRPRDPYGWLTLEWIVRDLQGYEAAESVVCDALRYCPDSPELNYRLAKVLDSRGDFDEERRVSEALKDSHPQLPLAYLGLARLAQRAYRFDEARMYAKQAFQRISPPETPELLMDLFTVVLGIPGEEDFMEEVFDLALRHNPKDPVTNVLAALSLQGIDDEQALAHMATARRYFHHPGMTFEEMVAELRSALPSQGGDSSFD